MRWFVLLLLGAGLAFGSYLLFRQEPAFDLDKFDKQINRLRAAYALASKVADTDSTTEQLELDLEYLESTKELLEAHADDCEETVARLEQRHLAYLEEQEELPERVEVEDIRGMDKFKKLREGQRVIAVLAPAWFRLAPVVEDFAWSCPEESEILDKVLGTIETAE